MKRIIRRRIETDLLRNNRKSRIGLTMEVSNGKKLMGSIKRGDQKKKVNNMVQ